MKSIVFWVCMCSAILYAEPSVYANSSQLNSANTKAIVSLKRQVAQQKERISGLTSVIEGLSATVNRLEQSSRQSFQSSENTNSNKVLQELAMMIDEINEQYISKNDLEKILASNGNTNNFKINKLKTNKIAKHKSIKKKVKPEENNNLEAQGKDKVYIEGVRFFVKQRYDEANKRFTLTDLKGYKPAASNYYLGEIAYYTKKYEDAIFYFKKSAGLYDKASYIDVLLLHTAISLEKTGEKAQARAFYDNIIENYKDKKSATIARKKLEKL